MISAQNISFKIGTKTLLHQMSLQFSVDKISLILGPNGAGKSTLIKLLSQEHKPSTGEIFIEEQNYKNLKPSSTAKYRAVLSQSLHLAFPLTVAQVVLMGRYPFFTDRPAPQDLDICNQALAFFDVADLAQQNYLQLSGGEKQRVQFARVAAQIWPHKNEVQNKYLLLDEPLTHLDIYHQYHFMAQLQKLMTLQKMAVIGVVHDINLALQFADDVVLIHQGKLVAHGTATAVITQKNITEVFGIKPTFFSHPNGKQHITF